MNAIKKQAALRRLWCHLIFNCDIARNRRNLCHKEWLLMPELHRDPYRRTSGVKDSNGFRIRRVMQETFRFPLSIIIGFTKTQLWRKIEIFRT